VSSPLPTVVALLQLSFPPLPHQTLAKNQLRIRYLHFDRNRVDPIGMVELSMALPFLPSLSSLSISHNPIGDCGLFFLCRGLLNKHRNAFHSLPLPPDLQVPSFLSSPCSHPLIFSVCSASVRDILFVFWNPPSL
jgi:hypothetical protein